MSSTRGPGWPDIGLLVGPAEEGRRLDLALRGWLPGFSRERLRALLREGRVRVDGVVVRTGVRLRRGAQVTVAGVPPPGTTLPVASPWLPLSVVYEDADLVAVSKPAGTPTLPLAPDETDTLANALVARFPELSGVGAPPLEAGVLYRLDNDTSGIVLAGRSVAAYAELSRAQDAGRLEKVYLALVEGSPPDEVEITWPVGHARDDRTRMVAELGRPAPGSRPARTRVRVVARGRSSALVEARIHAGVRHQIRVHLAALGHPVAGDRVYGGRSGPVPRHFLHALAIELAHPRSGEPLRLEAAVPDELRGWCEDAGMDVGGIPEIRDRV